MLRVYDSGQPNFTRLVPPPDASRDKVQSSFDTVIPVNPEPVFETVADGYRGQRGTMVKLPPHLQKQFGATWLYILTTGEKKNSNRILAAAGLAASTAEMAVGAKAVASPETGFLASGLGTGLFAVGLDSAQANVRTMIDGGEHDTLVLVVGTSLGRQFTYDEDGARTFGGVFDFGVHVLLGLGTSSALGAAKEAKEAQVVSSFLNLDQAGVSASGMSPIALRNSGLSVIPRPGMTARTVTASNGLSLTVWGQAEHAASTTAGHAEAMNNLVGRLAATGEYEYATLQRSWRTATGRVGTSRNLPDVIGVRKIGLVDAWEVQSATDVEAALRQRLRNGMNTLPPDRRGIIEVIPPEPPGK